MVDVTSCLKVRNKKEERLKKIIGLVLYVSVLQGQFGSSLVIKRKIWARDIDD